MTGGFIYRIFSTAVIAGGFAGLVLACIQQFTVVPMILEAEIYETGVIGDGHDHSHGQQQDDDSGGGHSHDEEAWGPQDGFERSFFTFANTMIIGIGFALLLVACYAIRTMFAESRVMNPRINWRWGILWGLGGFAAFSLAPALGLPPELPGAAAAELSGRQEWWLLAVALTAIGLLLFAFVPGFIRWIGLILIVIPHLLGAPQPDSHVGLAPPELASAFIYTSLVTNAVFWIVLGAMTAFLYDRFESKSTAIR